MLRFHQSFVLATALTCSVASSTEVMLGAFVPGDGFQRQEIVDFNAVMPKNLAFINLFSSFSHSWDHLYWQTTNIVEEGAMPMISWMPVDLDRSADNILPEIAMGLHDDYIDEWGARLVAWINQYPADDKPTILLRFGHEFNGNWYPYGNSPIFFQSAWQYIHDRFEAADINQHLEWVWSANNVDVDDYDNVVAYYPGSEYVDWTSIDGYNFGSNYAWTQWESFNETYADMYLTLVDNFPDKPILIAEVGSAEADDLPDPDWGQFGDDSDTTQSKSLWIADFLVKLEQEFPAVRATAWFNTDKELNWSLTTTGNTGVAAYIAGIQSDYFTSEFLSATETSVDEVEEVLMSFHTALDDATANYLTAQAQLDENEILLNSTAADLASAESLVSTATSSKNLASQNFTSAQTNYTDARTDYFDADEQLSAQLTAVYAQRTDLRQKSGEYASKKTSFAQHYTELKSRLTHLHTVRNQLVASTVTYREARDAYLDKLSQLEDTTEGQASDISEDEVESLRVAFEQAKIEILPSRASYQNSLQEYNDGVTAYRTAFDERNEALLSYRDSILQYNAEIDNYFEKRNVRNNSVARLRQRVTEYLDKRQRYLTTTVVFDAAEEQRAAKESLHQAVSSDHQILLEQNTDTYLAMLEAHEQATMQQQADSGLMLSDADDDDDRDDRDDDDDDRDDDDDDDRDDDDDSGKGNAKGFEKKAMPKVKKITKNTQRSRASSRRPAAIDPAVTAMKKTKIKNATALEKSSLTRARLSVIDY